MDIKVDCKEIISLERFELGWRFDKVHNSDISDIEKNKIFPLSENESKRLNKIIDHYEIESSRIEKYIETDWLIASSENNEKIEKFRNLLDFHLKNFNEDLIISWKRRIALKTTKDIFIKYWSDFLYPASDDVTVISEKTNWILFYNHIEITNIYIKQ